MLAHLKRTFSSDSRDCHRWWRLACTLPERLGGFLIVHFRAPGQMKVRGAVAAGVSRTRCAGFVAI